MSAALAAEPEMGSTGETASQAGGSQPEPDVIIFTDGEKLLGQVQSATSSSVVFKSTALGQVTVDWSKIQELRSSQTFAAIPKGVRLRSAKDTAGVPRGKLAGNGKQVEVRSASQAPQTMPVDKIGNIVPEASFDKALQRSSFFQGWTGGLTAGVSLTEATQNSRTFTAAAGLVRSVPSEDWLDLHSRTIFNYTQSYGQITEPHTPTVKTSLYHIGLEQDWYFSPRVFAFVQGLWDHNYSQGLDLQQTYGGGLGFVVFKSPSSEFDFKGSMDYINQRFLLPGLNKSLIGSIFGETYVRTFSHGILFDEQAAIQPAWNDTSAYTALGSATLTFPVHHHFGLTLGALDTFLNEPPPGFRKNSFQFTAGATYNINK